MTPKIPSIPIHVLQLEALLQRLYPNHSKMTEVESDYHRRLVGYRGEKALFYYLKQLPANEFVILHDIRLNVNSFFFQIDYLLLTNHFFLIIETKNIIGRLYFDTDFNQLIRIQDDRKERLPDPISQVAEHKLKLLEWFAYNNIDIPPIETLVCISNNQAILEAKPGNKRVYEKVYTLDGIKTAILKLREKHTELESNRLSVNKIADQLVRAHRPLKINFVSEFNIKEDEIRRGVFCEGCRFMPAKRENSKWRCSKCKSESTTAHERALLEYRLLFKDTITNKECREFLQIDSRHTVKRLMKTMNLPTTGHANNTVYHLNKINVKK